MKIIFTILAITIHLMACSPIESTKSKEGDIQQSVLNFHMNATYSHLSDEDRSIYSKNEFKDIWKTPNQIYLEPTSKYFEIETYLKKHIVSKVKTVSNEKIVITTHFPNVLEELYWFNDIPQHNKEKLDNIYSAYKSKLFDASKLKFDEYETSYEIRNGKIFVNLASIKKQRDIRDKINTLKESITSLIPDELSMLALSHHSKRDFERLLEFAKDIEKNISKVSGVRDEIIKLNPDEHLYFTDNFIRDATKVVSINRTFEHLQKNIVFNNVKISKSNDGDLALFGSYKYNGTKTIKGSSSTAYFWNSEDKLIGKQELEYFTDELFPGKIESFGRKIKDQLVAKKAKKVTIKPSMIF